MIIEKTYWLLHIFENKWSALEITNMEFIYLDNLLFSMNFIISTPLISGKFKSNIIISTISFFIILIASLYV